MEESVYARLTKLSELRDKGILTAAEFQTEKSRILDGQQTSAQSPNPMPTPRAGHQFGGPSRRPTHRLMIAGLAIVLLAGAAYWLSQYLQHGWNKEGVLPKAGDEAEAVARTPDNPVMEPPNISYDPVGIIARCYHLDSCNVARILSKRILRERNEVKLFATTLEDGVMLNPDADLSQSNVKWEGNSRQVYVLCSVERPTIAFPGTDSFIAEEFDFGGNGVPGVQQDNAKIYEAVCHNFFHGELDERAQRMGYKPLTDGGKGQYEIATINDFLN